MRSLSAVLLVALALSGCSDDGGEDDDVGGGAGLGAGSSQPASGSPTGTPAPPPSAPRTHESVMRNNEFVPADFTVRVGDTIHWTTEDPQEHNVVSETPGSEFRSEDISIIPVAYQQEFSYTFQQEGVVDHVCEYHSGMVGTVTVSA